MSEKNVIRKPSVLTKSQVCELLQNFGRHIASLKSPREIREALAELIRVHTPQSRGRRRGSSLDLAALQATVEEAQKRIGESKDASTLACMVSSVWNTTGENYVKCPIDTQRVRSYVEKGKIKFPDGIVFTPRQKRVVAAVATPTEPENNTVVVSE